MTPDLLFQIANPLALVGWIALALGPLAPRATQAVAGIVVPLALSAGYTAIVLAFDLFVGAWVARTARREGIGHLSVLPCLAATFLFGPAGYLLFQGLRLSLKPQPVAPAARARRFPFFKELSMRTPAHVAHPPAAPSWLGALAPARLAADSPRYTALGVLLALATIPVLGALALDARLFQGLNVWVKPLKFLVALVVCLLTLAWFARWAAPEVVSRPWWRWHERSVVLAVLAEIVWVAGAAALGTGSHFNVATPLLGALYGFMGFAAVLLTSATATLAYAIHRHRRSGLTPALKSGLVWGLALTLPLTLVTAGTLSALGGHWVGGTASDASGIPLMGWSREGGDLRVAHFFSSHAMHLIPLAAWGLTKAFGPDIRIGLPIGLAYAGFVAHTFMQALRGQPFLAGFGA